MTGREFRLHTKAVTAELFEVLEQEATIRHRLTGLKSMDYSRDRVQGSGGSDGTEELLDILEQLADRKAELQAERMSCQEIFMSLRNEFTRSEDSLLELTCLYGKTISDAWLICSRDTEITEEGRRRAVSIYQCACRKFDTAFEKLI